MPDDRFANIVKTLSKRLAHLLRQESCIGNSSRVVGAARLKTDELNQRLELLRDHLPVSAELCKCAAQYEPKVFQVKVLRKSLKAACAALDRATFKGIHAKTLYNKLVLIVENLQIAREILHEAAFLLSNRIDSEARLDLCTTEEVAALYEEEQSGRVLVACLRADAELDRCLSETWFVLKGRFGWVPNSSGGPYAKSRGAQVAAHLIGTAKGLGLDWTRNKMSPAYSACDAAAAARVLPHLSKSETASSVHAEIPMGYEGMEHIWREANRNERLGSHMQTGVTLGERLAQNSSKSVS